jgi:DNA polymerase-3 subunit delta'
MTRLSRPCPWQDESWQKLRQALDQGRLPHALLISGVPGSGRDVFASAAARLLLCQSPQPQGNCGDCKSCRLTEQGSHADFFALRPSEPGKRIGVDQVRDLLGFAVGTSTLGSRKVILVSPLEAFTGNAFNAILKGLEEPADGTFLLLIAARGAFLPATIRSRCQQMVLAAPGPEQAAVWLQAQAAEGGADGQGAAAADLPEGLLRLLPGRPLDALRCLETGQAGPLLALDEALQAGPRGAAAGALQRVAAAVPEEVLLQLLSRHLQSACAVAARGGDREMLREALRALDRLAALRRALLSGCNPNSELLRVAAVRAWSGVWSVSGGAKLHAPTA